MLGNLSVIPLAFREHGKGFQWRLWLNIKDPEVRREAGRRALQEASGPAGDAQLGEVMEVVDKETLGAPL